MRRDLPSGVVFLVWQAAGLEYEKPSRDDIKRVKCIESGSHKNGDLNPSAYLYGPKNCFVCHGCGVTLSAKALAEKLGVNWTKLLEGEMPKVEPRPAPPPRPEKRIEEISIESFWSACMPVNQTIVDPHMLDLGVAFYLARRGWHPPTLAALDLVRVTPLPDDYKWPSWWPRKWSYDWRLVTRAYKPNGKIAGFHARAITPDTKPKTRWPFGYDAHGLLMADRRGVALLRREPVDAQRVIIVEGMTDLIAMSMAVEDAGRTDPIIGITSGATRALTSVRFPNIPVVVLTDEDAAGEKYAREIREAIPPTVDVRRARLTVSRKAAAQ
jgi:5S rRNA maturation endonuclease (ribonuclease M5)